MLLGIFVIVQPRDNDDATNGGGDPPCDPTTHIRFTREVASGHKIGSTAGLCDLINFETIFVIVFKRDKSQKLI